MTTPPGSLPDLPPLPLDFHLLAAQHRYGLPTDWQWRTITSLDGGFIELAGASPIGTYQRGKRKGLSKFPPKASYRRVIITHQNVAEARHQWEAKTGMCSWCQGTGQQVASISIVNGITCRPCPHCNGSGTATLIP
jgi:hypothetical protein